MLTVTESGEGTPLVLLHGWGLHSGVWLNILPELNKRYHCYTVDMLGHGQSLTSDSMLFDLANMRKALHHIITKIDAAEVTLLGWSLGGLVAMDYIHHNSDKIKKLILVASNASFCKKEDWFNAIEQSVLENFASQLELDYKKTVDKFMALQMFGADDYKQSLKILKQSMASRPEPSMQALREGLEILKVTDLRTQLSHIEQPVLMITGEHDRLMPYQAADAMQLLLGNARHKMMRGAGHAPFISHPDEFVQVIKDFSKE